MKYDIKYIEQIAKIVTDNSLSEITLGQGEDLITIRKDVNIIQNAQVPSSAVQNIIQHESEPVQKVEPLGSDASSEVIVKKITSPMVGAFYASPAPGAKPFVKVGDTVSAGQVVCIIEAMKLMNEIESDVSGTVKQICVEDGQSVEYGQVLMYIE